MSLQVKNARMSSQGTGRYTGQKGDPGLLGGILGGIGGFLTGGPAGAVAGAIGGYRGGGSPGPSLAPQGRPPINLPGFGPPGMGVGGRTTNRISIGEQAPAQGIPSGYRLNKSDYFLKDGTFVPKGTKLVKIRRRNAMNPKALSRAMSRISMAKNAAKKLSRVTIRKPASCK